jgi:hypothetical protein
MPGMINPMTNIYGGYPPPLSAPYQYPMANFNIQSPMSNPYAMPYP